MRSQSALAERLGVGRDLLDAMYHIDANRDRFTPAQLVALRYCERVTTAANDIDAQLWSELQDHFDDDAIVELTTLIGYINALNRMADAFGLT